MKGPTYRQLEELNGELVSALVNLTKLYKTQTKGRKVINTKDLRTLLGVLNLLDRLGKLGEVNEKPIISP